ncbi:hypothetical protein XM38_036880 [Halomicronema hongdechloris C2206]|uniref:VWA containing CoxE family protein n=1 Tax=Halomicronema hongdechloris C2206 TaxID=1641165 RepID=A0A1Z3HQY9_9CYAN|nr:VWA containing CoxE family protein [Halomicronema hongdechloris]ASC72730.1 hypothetical protein XM38_036880 [Halomicronema hongdechloris C2206]
MTAFDPQALVLRTFLQLRRSNFKLGVADYMAALDAVAGGFGEDLASLEDTLKLLWCHSLSEHSQFQPIWQSVHRQVKANRQPKPPFPGGREAPSRPQETVPARHQASEPPMLQPQPPPPPPRRAALGSLPVQAPSLLSGEEDTIPLQAYYPISRRSMVYNWRYLRRPVADGPQDVLDIDATIQQVTRQGFYLAPVYGRRERNQARLLLFIDHDGSMTPFHQFTGDLVETAQQESPLDAENVNAVYFQNVPAGTVFRDVYLTQSMPLAAALGSCDPTTSVLIVSDGGAARGYRLRDRVRSTSRFLLQLKRHTSLVAWLNPMPRRRWVGSSAEIIAHSVPMFQMDSDGLNNAIDVVRGQPLKHTYSAS